MSADEQSTARFQVRVTSDSHFAWARTRLALERHAHGVGTHVRGADRLRVHDRPILPATAGPWLTPPVRIAMLVILIELFAFVAVRFRIV